jgi:hypothetical protein
MNGISTASQANYGTKFLARKNIASRMVRVNARSNVKGLQRPVTIENQVNDLEKPVPRVYNFRSRSLHLFLPRTFGGQ